MCRSIIQESSTPLLSRSAAISTVISSSSRLTCRAPLESVREKASSSGVTRWSSRLISRRSAPTRSAFGRPRPEAISAWSASPRSAIAAM